MNMSRQTVLKTKSLTKSYQGKNVLQDVSVTLEAGKIYGLIGQNGAGKTTFMRLLTGLAFPTGGTIELFGCHNENELQQERQRLGSMIEYPAIVPYMTAKENLRFYRVMRGIPNQEAEEELLELTGLAKTGGKKVKDFSLGMKQRLGIAIALLTRPELLILDEPINGLDPVGVVEIRHLLKKLCDEQHMTILISSHNLPELYQTATDYLFIHEGRLKQTLTQEQLEEACKQHLLISSDQPERLVAVLETKLTTANYLVMPDQSVKLYDYLDDREKVARALFENGVMVTTLAKEGDTLEDYFLSIIGGGGNG